MTEIVLDPAELAAVAQTLRQSAATLDALAGQLHASCCCCAAPPGIAGDVDAAGAALRAALQSGAGDFMSDAEDLARRGASISGDQSLAMAAAAAWGGPAAPAVSPMSVDPGTLLAPSVVGGTNQGWTVDVPGALLGPSVVGGTDQGWTGPDASLLGPASVGGTDAGFTSGDLAAVLANAGSHFGPANYGASVFGGALALSGPIATHMANVRAGYAVDPSAAALQFVHENDTILSNLINGSGMSYDGSSQLEQDYDFYAGQRTGALGIAQPLR